MKNFLSKHYDHYYIQIDDEQTVETTRVECIAPGEEPTAANPYKQRWYYDIEASYIIRLSRNEQGEKLYRENATLVRKEERYYARKYACLSKGTGNCDNDCANCTRTRISRTVELDKLFGKEGSDDCVYLEIEAPDHFAELEEEEDKKEEYKRLYEVIGLLSDKQKLVCNLYLKGKTAKEIGGILGVSKEAIVQQLSTIKKKIKKLF